jgi:PAS domain S-box-containing protein
MSPMPNKPDLTIKISTSNSVADDTMLLADVPRSRIEAPWIILAALLVATILTAYQSHQRAAKDAEARFSEMANRAAEEMLGEIRHVEDAMSLAGAVVAASPDIDNARWNAYLDMHHQRESTLRGLAQLEYRAARPSVNALSGSDKSALAMPPSLIRSYTYTKASMAGNDVSNSMRILDAIAESRTSSRSVISTARPSAGADNRAETAAFVKPVYPVKSANEPIGYMVAIIYPLKLLGRSATDNEGKLVFSILQGEQTLFESASEPLASGALKKNLPIMIGQRELTLSVKATPRLMDELSSRMPMTILFVGILGTMLMAGMVWLLTRLREQATSMARNMTLKLRDQVKFTDDLIELNPNPIYRKDAQGRFIVVNRAWEQLHKRPRADVLGKTSRDFQDPSIIDAAERFDEDVMQSAAGFEARESMVINALGEHVPTLLAKQVIKRADGTFDGIIGNVTDVTLVKKLQSEVARQREQLDMVIRASQQGIFDVDGNAGGERYYSQRFCEILGFDENNMPQYLEWHQVIVPEDMALFRAHLVEHFKQETPYFDLECRARYQRTSALNLRSYVWLRIRGVAQLDANGCATRFVGSIVDVTERREAEQMLIEANTRVVEAARAKESFLATMSHEIRTPLNGVLGMAGLLADTKLNDEQRDYIRLIRASGDTLLRLINDVLDFSKIESGHMTLESVSVEFVTIIEEAFELVAEKAREKKLALVYSVDRDIPAYIFGDATRIRQILLNLVSNAIKFTEAGEVFLHASVKRLDDQQLEIQVSIRDTGIGIPADRIDQLFQPFTQADASTTRKYGGTGLGLAIVKRLTEMMGGKVSLTSIEGQGSTFSFSMLTKPARGPLRPHMQNNIAEFMGKTLLFVDASPQRRQVVSKRYAAWGMEILTAAPAQGASHLRLRSLDQKPVDILVTDTVLPSPELTQLSQAVAEEDEARLAAGKPHLYVVLMSIISRAELATIPAYTPIRHDFLVMRPTSRARMFDVLMQATTGRINHQVATRAFTETPIHDANYAVLTAPAERPLVSLTPAEVAATLHIEGSSAGQLNVLVAEDNEVNQRVIEGMLKRLGHRATIVADGQLAIAAMAGQRHHAAEPFDIVLMDIHMPVLDGVAAMKAIKALFIEADETKRLHRVPVVAMTAHALAGDRQHYLNEGMDDYISKPIRNDELASMLVRQLPHKIFASDMTQPLRAINAITTPKPARAVKLALAANTATTVSVTAVVDTALPMLDYEQLEDLRGLPADANSNEAPGHGLIGLFKTKSHERIRIMASCLVDSNWVMLGDTAHSLRGAAASIGFPRVAASCKILELAARRLSPKDGMPEIEANTPMPTQAEVDRMFEAITLHFYEAEAALSKWLESTV